MFAASCTFPNYVTEVGVIVMRNGNDVKSYSLNMTLWIFPSGKLYLSSVNSTFQFFMVSSMFFMTLSDILDFISCFLWLIHAIRGLFSSRFTLLDDLLINVL